MLDLQIIASGRAMPIFDLPATLGRSEAAREIGDTIDALIALVDDLGGDPDLEDNGDDEPDADGFGDPSWPEWHGRGRHKLCANGAELPETVSAGTICDDAEDDDPAGSDVVDEPHDAEEDMCLAGDDGCGPTWRAGQLHWGSVREDDGV